MDIKHGKRVMICVFVDDAETIFTLTDTDSDATLGEIVGPQAEIAEAFYQMARTLRIMLPTSSAGYHAHMCERKISEKFIDILHRMANPSHGFTDDLPF